ncbi:MAG: helix-turn-helix domain-containing protein [Pseudomonadota bacterium]
MVHQKALNDSYLTKAELSELTGISIRTVHEWLHAPSDPLPHYKIGRRILVRRSEFDAWAAKRRVSGDESPRVDAIVNEVLSGMSGAA